MSLSIEQRVRHCDCYMCINPESATCVELEFFYLGYSFSEINVVIKKIKRKLFKRDFLTYAKCLKIFVLLYEEIVENRYRPYGKGYEETKIHFDKCLKYKTC
jgi:hypothetical protein